MVVYAEQSLASAPSSYQARKALEHTAAFPQSPRSLLVEAALGVPWRTAPTFTLDPGVCVHHSLVLATYSVLEQDTTWTSPCRLSLSLSLLFDSRSPD